MSTCYLSLGSDVISCYIVQPIHVTFLISTNPLATCHVNCTQYDMKLTANNVQEMSLQMYDASNEKYMHKVKLTGQKYKK